MEAPPTSPTSPQSEPDQDNSSLQNPSTNPAEAGTTEPRDDDHETSSIEALNWSEVEEEELAQAQQAEALAKAQKEKEPENVKEDDKIPSSLTTSVSTVVVNDEGNVLSTSLLQSINSTVSDEDPEARKHSVIENWAEEVTNAVERGEIELTEDFPDEGVTGDDENEEEEGTVRRRKGKRLTPDMVTSITSSASNGDSVDPMSNVPVLDDGPIWNKGPRSYRFEENRRINQKLTFCVLIAVVLAIGLGLGNLVAHQECEAEFKAQKKVEIPTIPTTTPAPIIPDRSTDSSMMGKLPHQSLPSIKVEENEPDKQRREEPIIDPKFQTHADVISKVVTKLDRLSREINQNENITRKLQGVVVIPNEEKEKESEAGKSEALYDKEVHRDDNQLNEEGNFNQLDPDWPRTETSVDELIDAIEQTPEYLKTKKDDEVQDKFEKEKPRSKLFDLDKILPEEINREWKKMVKSYEKYQEFERRFIKNERKRLVEEGKYDRFKWRVPEQYSDEEKKALNNKFKSTWLEYIKLDGKGEKDPLDTIFGVEEEIEDRKYGDIFHYPWPDPDEHHSSEDYAEQFRKNMEEVRAWEKERIKQGEIIDIPEEVNPEVDLDRDFLILLENSEKTLETQPSPASPVIQEVIEAEVVPEVVEVKDVKLDSLVKEEIVSEAKRDEKLEKRDSYSEGKKFKGNESKMNEKVKSSEKGKSKKGKKANEAVPNENIVKGKKGKNTDKAFETVKGKKYDKSSPPPPSRGEKEEKKSSRKTRESTNDRGKQEKNQPKYHKDNQQGKDYRPAKLKYDNQAEKQKQPQYNSKYGKGKEKKDKKDFKREKVTWGYANGMCGAGNTSIDRHYHLRF